MSFYRRKVITEDQIVTDEYGVRWIHYASRTPVDVPDELQDARRRDSISIVWLAAMDLFVQGGWTPVGALETREYEEVRTAWDASRVVEYRLEVQRPVGGVELRLPFRDAVGHSMGYGWRTVMAEAYLALCDKPSQPLETPRATEAETT